MAGESGRLGLLQGRAGGAQAAGEASLGSQPRVQSARRGRGQEGGRPPARPGEPGLPIVNIYLTSVTPARHRCLPPPPHPLPAAPSPLHLVAGARGASLARALSAHSARRSCSPADARPPCR